jgi:hypothetical protein
MTALVAEGMHYIRAGDGSEELYSLGADAEERFNLADSPMASTVLRRFRASLVALLRKR